MTVLKCKMCGGTLELENENCKVVTCEYCNTTQTVPILDNEKKILLHNRANAFRLKNEFDKAMIAYENIVEEFTNDAEAYWGLVLSKYGIEYVNDPKTGKKIPTCHRTLTKSILNDDDYLNATKHSDVIARALYEKEAQEIDRLQKEILEISQKEEPYDIFICYKETDNLNRRTMDSVIAQDIYDELTKRDYKVFFSRITLESKLGSQFEPIIYAALNSSKVMITIGTKAEYFNAVWVKNEWSRFIDMINNSRDKKYLIPCYKDIDAYDLPEELVSFQCQDLNKLGYMQDLIRGIDKLFDRKPKIVEVVREKIVETKQNVQYVNNDTYKNIVVREEFVRITMHLEMGNFVQAAELVNKLLAKEMKNARLWIFSLLAQLKIKREDLLKYHTTVLTKYNQYNKALEYADNDYKRFLLDSNKEVEERIEKERVEYAYSFGIEYQNKQDYDNAISKFKTILEYKDSKKRLAECEELNKELRLKNKNFIYETIKKFIESKSRSGYIIKDELEKYNINFLINYNAYGGELTVKVPEGDGIDKIIAINNCGVKKPDYDFVKWNLKELSVVDNLSSYDVKIDFQAKLLRVYTIEYDMNPGEKKIVRFSKPSDVQILIPNRNSERLFFQGWYDDDGKEVVSIKEEKNYRLKARWNYYLFDKDSNNKRLYFGFAPIKEMNIKYDRYVSEGEILYYNGKKYTKSSDWKYYLIEPLLWDIVEQEGNKYKLVTTNAFLPRKFYEDKKKRFKNLRVINPNNYQLSHIRAYLNGLNGEDYGVTDYENYYGKGFVNMVFGFEQKNSINPKSISELLNGNKPILVPNSGLMGCDYVYLLSAEDMDNPKINTIKNGTYMLRTSSDSKTIDVCVDGKVQKGDPTEFYPIRLGMEITINDKRGKIND